MPIAALFLAALACASSTGDTQTEAPTVVPTSVAPPPVASARIPEISFGGLRTSDSTLDLAAAAEDAVEPDALASMLTTDGFVGAGQRVYTGGPGSPVRLVVRKWIFSEEAGAHDFLAWIRDRPAQLIGSAGPVDTANLPSSVSMVVHEPSGCCHEETPIYLAAWPQGTAVWTVRSSGPAISYKQATAMTMLVEFKTRDG
jgi:hypothetical protein